MEALALELAVEAMKFMVEQLNEQKHLIGDAPNQVKELEKDVMFLKDYLTDAVKKPKSNSLITRTLIREARDSVNKAEDAVDSFIVEVAENDSRWFSGAIANSKLVYIANVIKTVAENVKKIREKVEEQIIRNINISEDEELEEYEGSPGKQKYAPIFEEDEKRLRELLAQEAEQPEATIFVTGAHGIGKTTLAAKMFHDSDIRVTFTKHIWVSVSNPTARNIFLVVLRQLNKLPEQGSIPQNNWELSQLVKDCLEGETFLIILDNVSEINNEDWKRFTRAFESNDRKSKVLITSNNDETARFIVRYDSQIIKLKTLSFDESWSMLQFQVFSKTKCPPELVNDGKLIAGHCNGMPQAIVFAGDTLARRDSDSYQMIRRQKIWQEVSLGLITYFDDGIGAQNTSIMSSYNRLPYQLRPCFLYMGIFPENSHFSVSKLIRMWIAEGFIRPNDGVSVTLEKTAQDYLMYLIDRNLVVVEEKRPDGSAKTCSMNELLYNFCKTEAGKGRENFLQEFRKCGSDGAFSPPINEVEKNRRVSIHGYISNFIPKLIASRHSSSSSSSQSGLRSFVSHANEVFALDRTGDISTIRAAFKLVRVLDVKPLKFNIIHNDLCHLVHLRFVSLSLNADILPAAISRLRNIQTLIVHTTSRTLKIKADILKMDELRHFKTNASASLSKKSKGCKEDERLQTLSGVSPESCTQEFFSRTPNLKKLGIHGPLAMLLHDDQSKFLSNLVKVEKLKLINDVTNPKYEGKLCTQFLQSLRLLPSLMSLTLYATSLDWEHISILGSLQNLEELKLKDNAFVGVKWEVHEEGFPNLHTLHIEGLDFKQWKCSNGHFPQLARLKLSDCKELREIPIELANIRTFRELHLRNGSDSAAESAQNIRAEKLKMRRNDKSIIFKLSIDDL